MRAIKLFFLLILFYIYKETFQYCHPIDNSKYNLFFYLSLVIGFLPYLISDKVGRVFLIITAISFTRLSPISGISNNLICNFAIIMGGIFGTQIRNKSKLEYSNVLMLLVFLNFLLIERFLIYFNFPYLNGYSLQETFYNLEISSKTAYAISIETIYSIYFPLLWIYLDKEKNKKDFLIGIFFLVLINLIILSIQKFISPEFLRQETNLSLEVGRPPAMFRDSSSSSVILSISFFLILLNIKLIFPSMEFTRIWIQKYKIRFLILFLFFSSYFYIILSTQGRTSLGVLFFGVCILFYQYHKIIPTNLKIIITAFIFISFIFLIQKLEKTEIKNKFQNVKIESFEDFIKNIDPPRYYLNLISFELFLEKPIFGNGIGSFIPELKDQSRKKTNPINLIDNPGSLYTGILFEIGVLGAIFIFLNLGENFFRTEIIFLLLVFLVGYHFVHPDIAFFCLVLIFGFSEPEKQTKYKLYLSNLILLFFLIQLTLNYANKENLFEFRKTQNSKFQLNPYSKTNDYFIFKGNLIWKTENKNNVQIEFFLDNSTKREKTNLLINFLNKEKKIILQETFTIEKNNVKKLKFQLKENSNSLEVYEIDRFRDFTPICIPKKYFNSNNEFILSE